VLPDQRVEKGRLADVGSARERDVSGSGHGREDRWTIGRRIQPGVIVLGS